nr:MAG TPA: hypothetical protein [Caudoviricetes sp.]
MHSKQQSHQQLHIMQQSHFIIRDQSGSQLFQIFQC